MICRQVNSSWLIDPKLSALMLTDKSYDTCFCIMAAGLHGSCTAPLRKQKLLVLVLSWWFHLSP